MLVARLSGLAVRERAGRFDIARIVEALPAAPRRPCCASPCAAMLCAACRRVFKQGGSWSHHHLGVVEGGGYMGADGKISPRGTMGPKNTTAILIRKGRVYEGVFLC